MITKLNNSTMTIIPKQGEFINYKNIDYLASGLITLQQNGTEVQQQIRPQNHGKEGG